MYIKIYILWKKVYIPLKKNKSRYWVWNFTYKWLVTCFRGDTNVYKGIENYKDTLSCSSPGKNPMSLVETTERTINTSSYTVEGSNTSSNAR